MGRGNVEDPKDLIINSLKGRVTCKSLKNVIYTKKKILMSVFPTVTNLIEVATIITCNRVQRGVEFQDGNFRQKFI